MPVISVAGRDVFVEQRGNGEPLLLIQGMAGHHRMWGEPFLSALTERFTVIAFDHRGIGQSADVAGPMTIGDLAGDALAVLDALSLPSAHVLGISMGGMVAQHLTLIAPDRVRGLVLGCTYAGGPGSTLAAPGPMKMLAGQQSGNVDTSIRAAYEANLSPGFRADESTFEPFLAAARSVTVPVNVVLRQVQAAYQHNVSARLHTISSPVLIVHGTADEMLDPVNARQIHRLTPTSTLHTMDGVGHLFWWERPTESAALVVDHLTQPGTSAEETETTVTATRTTTEPDPPPL